MRVRNTPVRLNITPTSDPNSATAFTTKLSGSSLKFAVSRNASFVSARRRNAPWPANFLTRWFIWINRIACGLSPSSTPNGGPATGANGSVENTLAETTRGSPVAIWFVCPSKFQLSHGLNTDETRSSINQNQNRRVLRRLHHVLKLPVNRDWLFKFCGNIRHRFKEAQEQTALHRVIHMVAVRKDSGSDPVAASAAAASSLAATMPTTFPRASTSAPPELPGCTSRLIWK